MLSKQEISSYSNRNYPPWTPTVKLYLSHWDGVYFDISKLIIIKPKTCQKHTPFHWLRLPSSASVYLQPGNSPSSFHLFLHSLILQMGQLAPETKPGVVKTQLDVSLAHSQRCWIPTAAVLPGHKLWKPMWSHQAEQNGQAAQMIFCTISGNSKVHFLSHLLILLLILLCPSFSSICNQNSV